VVILFTSGDLFQLFKLPKLVEHFQHHREENPQLTFADFLTGHYIHFEDNDADHEEDMKLPFKQSDFSASAISVYVPVYYRIKVISPADAYKNNIPVTSDRRFDSQFSASIWQPPQKA
jgi:hypothetical protein